MKEPAIVFKDFSFQYRVQHEPTLHDINLTIYKGEKVLILGSSGSGKSTLANCINGLIPFSHHGTMTGSVTVMGQETRGSSIYGLSKTVGHGFAGQRRAVCWAERCGGHCLRHGERG